MRNKTELGLYAWVVVIKTKFFKFKIIDYSENIYIYIYKFTQWNILLICHTTPLIAHTFKGI